MEVPGLGKVTKDEEFGWYTSNPIAIPMFGGKQCRVVLKGYDEDANRHEFHAAIANFLSGRPEVLQTAERDLYRYYEDFQDLWEDTGNLPIKSPADIWHHVHLGSEPMVTRRAHGNKDVYISIECECEWEHEHGLQIVLWAGLKVTKLGPYDGHLTNSDAYADDKLENVIYKSRR
jgi:hypothetical protein